MEIDYPTFEGKQSKLLILGFNGIEINEKAISQNAEQDLLELKELKRKEIRLSLFKNILLIPIQIIL